MRDLGFHPRRWETGHSLSPVHCLEAQGRLEGCRPTNGSAFEVKPRAPQRKYQQKMFPLSMVLASRGAS